MGELSGAGSLKTGTGASRKTPAIVVSTLEQVSGFASAAPVLSMTTADGKPRQGLIDGMHFRSARPVSHRNGYLTEAFRLDWGLSEAPVAQVNLTVTFPAKIRGWGIHRQTVDRLFAASGSFCIVCFDGRPQSPTHGCINEFLVGERNQGLIVIPTGIYHGWKNIGLDEAAIISMPSQLYDHEGPDRWELPWDSDEARKLIPYQWP